jgi:DNA-binding HxlR family transcriptional regulator
MTDLMDWRDEWSTGPCSIARALEVVGTRSAMLIMREAFIGTRRFDDFTRRVGIGEPATAARLRELTAAGLLERTPYREPGQRTRYEYQLTPKGRDLQPVLIALRQWGDAWAVEDTGPSVIARHRDCGAPVHAVIECERGHSVGPREMELEPGPGLVRLS